MRLAVVVLLLAACSKDTQDKVEKVVDKAGKATDDFVVEDLKASVAKVKGQLAAGEDTFASCASGMAMAKQTDVDAAKPLAAELTTLCEHDAPLGKATRAVDAAEKARAATTPSDVVSECFDEGWVSAKTKLDVSMKNDPAWVALKDRWTKACPE